MIKMSIFNKKKINDVMIAVDAFKNVFQSRSSEVLLPDVLRQSKSIRFTVNGVSQELHLGWCSPR